MLCDRTITSAELVEVYLAQIAQHNDRLNAICTLAANHARQHATAADTARDRGENWGALHGLPMTVKDCFATAGLRTTVGTPALQDYVPTEDATAVARLKAAGVIILGKSNLAELTGDFQSQNRLFPRVNNPWNLDYTAGGSSGGSVAAIATGMTPLELGNDFGGSTRQPAHFCGVYSLKPTDRRVSTRGHVPELPGQAKCIRQVMTIGCFARCVDDLRLTFNVIAGPDPLQPDVPPVPLDQPSGRSLSDRKIAWMDGWEAVPVDVEIQSAIRSAVNKLAQSGASVTQWIPDWLCERSGLRHLFRVNNAVTAFNNVYAKSLDFGDVQRTLPFLWREATQGEPALRQLSNLSQLLPQLMKPQLKDYFAALTARDRLTVQMDQALEPWDVWLCPVAATPAFTHRPSGTAVEINGRQVPYMLASSAYTVPFALTGHPVVVIPIGQTQSGLPIGIQIIGKRWQEMELLAIAQDLDHVK